MIGLAYVELLLRAANVRADDTSAESGLLHWLVSYPDWKRRGLSSLGWRLLSTTEISSNSLRCCHLLLLPFLLNVRNRTVHNFSRA